MVGAAGHLGVRINFLNFIALPITFGIGVENAVHVVARLAEGNPRDPTCWPPCWCCRRFTPGTCVRRGPARPATAAS
jgi:hypothetical protein